MGKYALLLAGQPRYSQATLESIARNILAYNDVDVYCHFWRDATLIPHKAVAEDANARDEDMHRNCETYIQRIQAALPINAIQVEDQVAFDVERFHPGTEEERVLRELGPHRAHMHFKRCNFLIQSQWYSVMAANRLVQRSGIAYDGVMRFRSDILVPSPMVFDTYDASKLNIPILGSLGDDSDSVSTVFHDTIAFGSPAVMDVYCDQYLHQDETLRDPRVDALLGSVQLCIFLKRHVGVHRMVNNFFGFPDSPVRFIARTLG